MPYGSNAAELQPPHRPRGGWLVVAILFAIFGAMSGLGALWSAFIEGEWWGVVTLPLWGAFYFWLVAGALRRARR